MTHKKIHFVFEKHKEPNAGFAKKLIAELGQNNLKDADVVVTVGGDGLLLQALGASKGKPIYAIKPPTSNSMGFWTDDGVGNAEMLLRNLKKAKTVTLLPLKADIQFTNKQRIIRHAFNSLAIERDSGQAAFINLTAQFKHAFDGPHLISGDGLIFSTALGSTGMNRSYGGPSIDIENNVIILTGKGIYRPAGATPVVVNAENVSYIMDFTSVAHKRPIRIDCDGLSVKTDDDGCPIESVKISVDTTKSAKLLITTDPRLRTFSSLIPR